MRLLILVVFLVSVFSAYAQDQKPANQQLFDNDNLPEFPDKPAVKTLYAKGYQVYICNKDGAWDLHQPLATLYSDKEHTKPVGLHYGACNQNGCKKKDEVSSPDGECKSGRNLPTHKRGAAWTLDGEPFGEIVAVDKIAHPSPDPKKDIPQLSLLTDTKYKPGTGIGEIDGIERTDLKGGVAPPVPCTQGAIENKDYEATYKFFDVAPNLPQSKDPKKPSPAKKYKNGEKINATKV